MEESIARNSIGTLAVTVDTDDPIVLQEVGRMFTRLAERRLGGIAPEVRVAATRSGEFTAQEVRAAEFVPQEAFTAAGPDLGVDAMSAMATPPTIEDTDGAGPVVEPPAAQPQVAQPQVAPAAQPQVAPVAPPAPPAAIPPAASVELDKQNLPWDFRINTENKAKTQKGIWKTKKGLPEGFYDNVIAELKVAMGAPVPAAPPAAAPVPAAPPAAAPVPAAAPPAAPPAPVAPVTTPPAPVQPPAPPAAIPPVTPAPLPDTPPTDFGTFLQWVTARTNPAVGKLSAEEVTAVCNSHGLPSLPLVCTRLDLIPAIYADLKAICDTRA